ncbi:uncharacterized protein LOC117106074 [Anneissia japonica]|uniref:uncharacterized protein LOC117106074 n=1 Tax=Anneissia japonica TaxID=1529436 RepID=UPI0014259421|nr:uncharacterized protein LOC117106074 [Anneissia japonica]
MARKIVNRCVECRQRFGKVMLQKMANLPEDRLEYGEAPLTNAGMDYFGPLEVKQGRSSVKYGVVFACMACKAIHLEVADSLDIDACVNAIRRFVSRPGPVKLVRSDNGTNIVGAQREMKQEIQKWNQSNIHDSLLQRGIDWVFNPPSGSHHGGIWERQIRSIRKIMCSLVREQSLTHDTLVTFMCEVEAIINGRPITKSQEDPNDLEPLSPNHLLQLKSSKNLPPLVDEKNISYHCRRWRKVQYLADTFWKRWTREYLPTLQKCQRWLEPKRNARVGDIVLVLNENTPRNTWPLGKIIQVFSNKDSFVRRVRVKTQINTLLRPVDKIMFIVLGR